MRLVQDKVALVTGAAAGLGAAQARLLAAEGANVILTDVAADLGASTAASISNALFLPQDVREPADWDRVLADIKTRFGRLDILVNNAGVVRFASIEDCSLDDFRLHMSVMAEGTFLGCQRAIPLMKECGGGSIVNIASIMSVRGGAQVLAYCAAKGAISAMTRSMAVHCLDQGNGVRVNAVLPGYHKTAMTEASLARFPEDVRLEAKARFGSPDEVANLVVFLASDASATINGAEIPIEGGRSLKYQG